ncbi:MAG: DHH family phosphoesterase [Eubacteriales bacterium]
MKKKNDIFRGLDELPSGLYVLFGILFIAGHIAVCAYTDIPATISGLAAIIIYSALCGIIFLICNRRINLYRTESEASEKQSGSVISAFRDNVNIPYAIVTETGRIITVNAAMRSIVPGKDTFFNSNISDICGETIDDILRMCDKAEAASGDIGFEAVRQKPNTVKIAKQTFEVRQYPIKSKGHIYYMVVFEDITVLTELSERHFSEMPVVAYIMIDNLEEIAQYVKVSYRSEANQVETILKNWAESMDGILREYDRDKYILVINRKKLAQCERNKFDILDSIRQVLIGDDNMPITVSIGAATTGETLAERERDALVALDTALQRGGDQVVLKKETGVFYFGGKTKSQQKRTKGHSRIIANKLSTMISNSSNVIVMGHSNPDFDSIGACVGVASLAMYLGVDVKIVADSESENFKSCTGKLLELDEYKNTFVDGVVGLGYSSFGTLLVIVDANNFSILEAPEIASKSFKTVVIDHHIKKEEFENEPALAYIDPSASSSCELITEILEQSLPAGVLKKEEANVMMSGIMVDTKNFTRTVGTRTFAAALYLRNAGASTEVARTFFDEAFDDYRSEALFGAGVEMYRDQIAITTSAGTDSPHDRVAAAKAADKLLTVRNINAAFALVKIGDAIHISARSNGSINVQLILEKIGGGGHFDMAGAALREKTLESAREMLIGAINEYLDSNKNT